MYMHLLLLRWIIVSATCTRFDYNFSPVRLPRIALPHKIEVRSTPKWWSELIPQISDLMNSLFRIAATQETVSWTPLWSHDRSTFIKRRAQSFFRRHEDYRKANKHLILWECPSTTSTSGSPTPHQTPLRVSFVSSYFALSTLSTNRLF